MKGREKEMEIGKREGMKDATDGKIERNFLLLTDKCLDRRKKHR